MEPLKAAPYDVRTYTDVMPMVKNNKNQKRKRDIDIKGYLRLLHVNSFYKIVRPQVVGLRLILLLRNRL